MATLYRNKCGHNEYERCFCDVCYPRTAFIRTMLTAASQRPKTAASKTGKA